MAERRMFAKTIIDSDAFLDMPLTTQALYFHLSMRADDEGFLNNPKKIMRMIGASEDELRLLVAKCFIIPFESGVCVIKHWRIHNYLRSDRFKPTVYTEERAQLDIKENNSYTRKQFSDTVGIPVCIPESGGVETQDSIGKVGLVEVSAGEENKGELEGEETADKPPAAPRPAIPYERIQGMYNELCPSLHRCTKLSEARKKAIKARISSGYTIEDFERLFRKAEASSFLRGKNRQNWVASFDFLVRDEKMARTLDGEYDDNNGGGHGNGTAASGADAPKYGTWL